MKSLLAVFSLVFCGVIFAPIAAVGEDKLASWYLPLELNDQNTKVSFELDSTWHTVHGATSGVSGSVSLANPADPSSIVVEVSLPVSSFNTDNSLRDSKLQSIMDAEEFPRVLFRGHGLSEKCTPAKVLRDAVCSDVVEGSLTIRDVTKPVSLPLDIQADARTFRLHGTLPILWADYGVEDPSILVAKVDDLVQIRYEVVVSP